MLIANIYSQCCQCITQLTILHVKNPCFFKKKHLCSKAQMLGNARIDAQAENPLTSGSQK